jgi:segregation and condensation protein A
MDVTEVALAVVTDEFVAYTRDHPQWDLGTASEFLVIAATLLDLKAARLLPGLVEEDIEDLELLEARDLLFARLLQYRAYKEVAAIFAQRFAAEGRRRPRSVPLEPDQAALLPDLVWTLSGSALAELASRVLTPKAPPIVSLAHLHSPPVSVREQTAIVVGRLRREHAVTFRSLAAGEAMNVVVARFLGLLELYRGGMVAFEQAAALGELTIRWTGGDEAVADIDEYSEMKLGSFASPTHAPHGAREADVKLQSFASPTDAPHGARESGVEVAG